MPHPRFTNEEIARRGEEIYADRLCETLERDCFGQVVIINVETGDYEIGPDSLAANHRALKKDPRAALYGIRIGSRYIHEFGSAMSRAISGF